MSARPEEATRDRETFDGAGQVNELWDRCARPACREQFQRSTERGRPREYCSDTCKKVADREYKQAQGAVVHYDKLLRQARSDVAAFGRGDQEGPGASAIDPVQQRTRAREAWQHARAVAAYATASDPRILDVLSNLVGELDGLFNDQV
ncbi:hypothetical protein [Nocardioides scoriae]|uniref:hypothetical protein n=1 Tax=Nocardioides scoriae TaxID=642780 RepID=UPI000B88C3F8|nr:hypothetical protein [Nocardioides scoriae]